MLLIGPVAKTSDGWRWLQMDGGQARNGGFEGEAPRG